MTDERRSTFLSISTIRHSTFAVKTLEFVHSGKLDIFSIDEVGFRTYQNGFQKIHQNVHFKKHGSARQKDQRIRTLELAMEK